MELTTQKQNTELDGLGLAPEDLKAFVGWALGAEAEPPDIVQKMMVNLSAKLSVGLGISIVGNLGRQAKLAAFLEQVESDLYDPGKLLDLTDKEKMSLYKEARATLQNLTESQRKFIAQAKELRPSGSEQEKLLSRIMALPQDKLTKIIGILDEDSASGSAVSTSGQPVEVDILDADEPDHFDIP